MADSTYRPRTYRERGGSKFVVATGGSIDVDGGEVVFRVGGSHKRAAQTATQDVTLTGADSGQTIYARQPSLTVKLPNATGNAGAHYRVVLATGGLAVATGLGIKVNPRSGDKLYGIDLTSTGNKVLNIVGATDNLGDFVDLESDGTSWAIVGSQGTWVLSTVT